VQAESSNGGASIFRGNDPENRRKAAGWETKGTASAIVESKTRGRLRRSDLRRPRRLLCADRFRLTCV